MYLNEPMCRCTSPVGSHPLQPPHWKAPMAAHGAFCVCGGGACIQSCVYVTCCVFLWGCKASVAAHGAWCVFVGMHMALGVFFWGGEASVAAHGVFLCVKGGACIHSCIYVTWCAFCCVWGGACIHSCMYVTYSLTL